MIADPVVLSLRIILALCLGVLLGMERTLAGKQAGIRTFALVSMGSALFVIISLLVAEDNQGDQAVLGRVIAGITTGTGFLGAGLIVMRQGTLSGLTTAAGLWVASGIGIGVGFGYYLITVIALFLALLTFRLLVTFENIIREKDDSGEETEAKNSGNTKVIEL